MKSISVLLSIKPKYVDEIIEGNKKYEFRKTIFRDNTVKEIFIYSSSPVKKIIGRFEVGEIIQDHPKRIWKKCKKVSGIKHKEFFEYFSGKNEGFAIEIEELQIFREPIDPKECFPNFRAPQSFCYFEKIGVPA